MALDLLYRLVMFVALLLAQVLILNHVHIFGVATPLLYVYFVVTFHRNFPRWIILLSSFLLGLVKLSVGTPLPKTSLEQTCADYRIAGEKGIASRLNDV